MTGNAQQRRYPVREVFDGLGYIARAGCQWRLLPHDLHPWRHGQVDRWYRAGCFENMADDPRAIRRLLAGRDALPSAAIPDSRTLQSSPESGPRAGYEGYKRRNGSRIHAAVANLGNLLALKTTPANEQDRAQVGELWAKSRKPPAGRSRWPLPVRAAPVKNPPRISLPQDPPGGGQTRGSQMELCAAA